MGYIVSINKEGGSGCCSVSFPVNVVPTRELCTSKAAALRYASTTPRGDLFIFVAAANGEETL